MSTIAGVTSHSSLSLMEFKTGKRSDEQQKDALFGAQTSVPQPRTVDANAERNYQAQQASEEGFARYRVGLQTTPNAAADTRSESGGWSNGLGASKSEEPDKALQEFQAYMSKSPAEKMRDSILKDMGLTEEDIEDMPPERQKAVEAEIAERMKDKAQMQAQADVSPEEQVYGVV